VKVFDLDHHSPCSGVWPCVDRPRQRRLLMGGILF
jgi:hypothetical protein